MESPKPFLYVHVRHFPNIVRNTKTSSQKRPSESQPESVPVEGSQQLAVKPLHCMPVAGKKDSFLLSCTYFQSNDRRVTQGKQILSNSKIHCTGMTLRLAHFGMPASFKTEDAAQKCAALVP